MSNLHPIFENVLVVHADQLAQLNRALRKADARRFTGEPVTGFSELGQTAARHEHTDSPEVASRDADFVAFVMDRVGPRSFISAQTAPTPTLHERMASAIAALAAEADNLDTCDYIGYGAVREHLEAAIAALGLCGVRSDEDIEREAAENASEARGEAQRDGDEWEAA